MAITRAQQYKQMLQKGGRIGLKPGGPPGGGATSMGSGRDFSGTSGTTGGGDTNREQGIKAAYQEAARRGALKNLATRQAEDKAEEAVEVFRNRNRGGAFNKVLNVIPGIGTLRRIASTFGPLNNRDFFLDRVAPKNFGAMSISKQQEMFDKYMDARNRNEIDAYGNPIGSDGGDDQQIIFPQYMTAQAPSTTEQEPEEVASADLGLRYRFMADGGMIDEETGRQMYGLGKLVKKATRAVKKVAKSPIGKAALMYTATGGLGNLAQGQGFFTNFISPKAFLGGAGSIFSKEGLRNILVGKPGFYENLANAPGKGVFTKATKGILGSGGALSVGKAITAASLLPLLGIGTGDESEEEAQQILQTQGIDIDAIRKDPYAAMGPAYRFYAEGGDVEPVAKKTMPLLDIGGMEKDYRAEGGFVPIGRMEKADDVPARLSKNEFVFTADAVRNAGDGDVDKGAEVMYNMMKNLEAGGEVSEESQGLEGARKMFQTSKRLEEVL